MIGDRAESLERLLEYTHIPQEAARVSETLALQPGWPTAGGITFDARVDDLW